MGHWGVGPFDNDTSLDYLCALAREHAQVNEDASPVPGTVDHAGVRVALVDAFEQVTDHGDAALDGTVEVAYAAAGLVAAALSPTLERAGGTRLGISPSHPGGADRLGLEHHTGFAELLDVATARTLLPAAQAAVQALTRQEPWLQIWVDRPTIDAALTQLAEVLALHQATTDG